MRFIYVDSGLHINAGHHVNCCRAVANELRKRAIPTTIIGFSGLDEALKTEFDAVPLLRAHLYQLTNGDPVAGWLNAFGFVAQTTQEDFARISGLSSIDIVYIASAFPGQLMGVIRWMRSLPPHKVPFVVVDLLGHPGLEVRSNADGFTSRPWREDPRAMLYRYTANEIAEHGIRRLVISYSDKLSANLYRYLLGREVVSLPLPLAAVTNRRNRAGRRPIVVGLLGDQRNMDKGYHFVPDVLTQLLLSHPAIRCYVHNSRPDQFPAAQEAMRALAAAEPRILVDERAVDATGWSQLLDATDLILCPYRPEAYQFMSSGIHAEAIANAVPTVVPAHTALSREQVEFGSAGTIFERFSPPSILAATRQALDNFDQYAERAIIGSEKWSETRGPAKLVDAIFALLQRS